VLCCLGVPLFLRRIGELTRGALLAGVLAAAALILIAVYAAVRALGERPVIVLVFAAPPLGAALVAALLRRRSPGRLAHVGIYDETSQEDLGVGPRRGIGP
jgi:hypothetical protein